MKIIVTYSGGKDSQACMIWAANHYGVNNIEAVFCDTGWENPITYKHIQDTSNKLGVKLTILKSKKYNGFIDLAAKKKRFPSTKVRFCTDELKSKPMNDFILSLNENVIVTQGIRKNESHARSQMESQCTYWKYYFEPYGYDKKGKPKYHTYRKKDVVKWVKEFNADIIRPMFDWTGQQVIDFIKENGQQPNPLYSMGFMRVGCFPCIMARHNEVLNIINRFPNQLQIIKNHEEISGGTFFAPKYIPKWAGRNLENKRINKIEDVERYLLDKNSTINMFEKNETSCSSYYHLCE